MSSPLPGDFASLLALRGIPFLGGSGGLSNRAELVPTQATTVFAFHFNDGVIMAGDRRATAGNAIVTDRVDKVMEIDTTSLLAIAGVPATAFEMARVLRSSFEYYRRSQLKPLSLAAKARSLSRLLRENLPMTLQGVGGVVPIFAGVDQSTNPPEPKVFFYDPLGAEFQATGHAASGSGSGAIRSIMAYEERFGDRKPSQMDVGAAIRFSLQLLMIAAEFDSATGGVQPAAKQFATIKVVRARGIETVSEAMQAEAFGQS